MLYVIGEGTQRSYIDAIWSHSAPSFAILPVDSYG
jgi:hypothetical protein